MVSGAEITGAAGKREPPRFALQGGRGGLCVKSRALVSYELLIVRGLQSLVDKLAAEFADEMNGLGTRVAAPEKKVDHVKGNGTMRY